MPHMSSSLLKPALVRSVSPISVHSAELHRPTSGDHHYRYPDCQRQGPYALHIHSGATFGMAVTVGQVADRVDRAVERLEERFDRIEARFDRLEARLENAAIVKSNRVHLDTNTGSNVYTARQKQVPGDGSLLAQTMAGNTAVPPLPPHANTNIGGVYSVTIDVSNLNLGPILGLIRFYNEDFGIQAGDTLSTRKQKIMNWLTLPMF
ncbi:hypothetical protein B0H14DRAFT_2674425 [Mycena olivaceomarginata]|nr:hypothetical protein B0H14DRAFT_2674425 [Mycena olivaceomarginata]